MKENRLHIVKKGLKLVLPVILVITPLGCAKKENLGNSQTTNNEELEQELTHSEEIETPVENSCDREEIPVENFSNEEEVVDYFNIVKDKFEETFTKENFIEAKEDVKTWTFSTMVTCIEFISDRKPIGGYYFSDLTTPVQLNVLEVMGFIEQKIVEHYPDYKEYIKEKWNIGYDAASDFFAKTKDKVEELLGEENYNRIQEGKNKVKEKFGDWKDNVQNWYQDKKEEYQ